MKVFWCPGVTWNPGLFARPEVIFGRPDVLWGGGGQTDTHAERILLIQDICVVVLSMIPVFPVIPVFSMISVFPVFSVF